MSGSSSSERVLSQDEFLQMAAACTAAQAKRGRRSEPVVPPPTERWERRHRAQSFIQGKELDELEIEVETGLYENVDLSHGSRIPVLLAHICFSFLWWSVFEALFPMLWFFPLCALQVSGYEPIVLLWFSPLLALWTPFRLALATPPALLVLRLLTLVGVASYQSPSPLTRLVVLAVGNCFAVLAFVSMWWGRSKLDRNRAIYTHVLGFLLMLAIRVWFSSFNPIFTNLLYNNMATGVGVVLALYLFFQDWRTPIITNTDLPSGKVHREESERYPGMVVTGLGFGALLFLTLLLFGDVSVVSRWTVAPYPNRGPYPYPWSCLVMVGLVLGVVLMSHRSERLSSLTWHAIGLASGLGLYYLTSYFAFFEGCLLSLYVASLWPHLSKRLTHYPPGQVLPIALLSWCVLCLASVWIVAYNFVPGGTLTRERTDILIAVVIFLISLPARDLGGGEVRGEKKVVMGEGGGVREGEGEKIVRESVGLRKRVVGKLPPITEEEEEEEEEGEGEGEGVDFEVDSTGSSVHEERALELLATEEKECHRFRHRANRVAVAILLFSLLGFAYRYHPISPSRQTEHPTMFSAGIWALHFGYDNDARPSMERAAQLINDTELDVIGLLETDAARPYIGNHDLGSWLSERLDMYIDYGPGTDKHTWGAMVLSKFPIVSSEHHLLPSPHGEVAPGLLVTVNVSGTLVDFYCVHFGNDVDELDRRLQAEFTGEVLARAINPVVLLSYLTHHPNSPGYNTITERGRVKDIDVTDVMRWCEYIMYRGLVKLGYARISHGGLTDTELQIGKFRLPDYEGEPDNEEISHNSWEVPHWTHFPGSFGELYHYHYPNDSEHRYHMNTPKYFTSSYQ